MATNSYLTDEEIEELLKEREEAQADIDTRTQDVRVGREDIERMAPVYRSLAGITSDFAKLAGGQTGATQSAIGEIDRAEKGAQIRRSEAIEGLKAEREAAGRPIVDIKERLGLKKIGAQEKLLPKETELKEMELTGDISALPEKQEIEGLKRGVEKGKLDPKSDVSKLGFDRDVASLKEISKTNPAASTLLTPKNLEVFKGLSPVEREDVIKTIKDRPADASGGKWEFRTASTYGKTEKFLVNDKTGEVKSLGTMVGDMPDKTGRSGEQIQSDLLRKDYDKEMGEVRSSKAAINKTRQTLELAKTNPEAVSILQYDVARSLAGEKGPLSNQDVQRAAAASPAIVDQIVQVVTTRGIGALTPGQLDTLERLLSAAEGITQQKETGIRDRYKTRAQKANVDYDYITGEDTARAPSTPSQPPATKKTMIKTKKDGKRVEVEEVSPGQYRVIREVP